MTDDDIPLHLMYGANHLAMDEAFRARMHAAIEAGLETAPIGVVTTPGTSNPKYSPTEHPYRQVSALSIWPFSCVVPLASRPVIDNRALSLIRLCILTW